MNKLERIQAYKDRAKWAKGLLDEIKPEGVQRGVEIGVWKADFAVDLLAACKRLQWYGVDPYFEYGHKHRRIEEWNETYRKVMLKMSKFGHRFISVREESEKAAIWIPNELDLVFIDGNHDYDFVTNDIQIYESKLKEGGILSGHDYIGAEVKDAVDTYASIYNREIIHEDFDPAGIWWWRVQSENIIDLKKEIDEYCSKEEHEFRPKRYYLPIGEGNLS